MRRGHCFAALLAFTTAFGQQGLLPMSNTIDAPFTALMHRPDVAVHSAIRPYLREDVATLPGVDSLLHPAWKPLMGRITDPARRLHFGPVLDALAGASVGEADAIKYRAGAGAWVEWNASNRWTLGLDAEGWAETFPTYLDSIVRASEVTPGEGFAQRAGNGFTHFDWNGYADYKAGQYFHLTLGKGRNFFGEGYRSLLLSDEVYSYPYFRITTTAWHIRYVNLFALMDDIRGAGGDPTRFAKKFTSMHYLSWNISNRVNAGFFEAIVWQDNDPKYPRGFDISYVNPVIFYRPVEFSLGSPDNALLGFALNVKAGKRTMLYSQVILDEFLLSHVRAGDGWYGNKQGVQIGAVSHDVLGKQGLMLRAEMNYVRPFMYTHTDTRQNYAHYGQPLAHPYGSGFMELLAQGEWRKGRWVIGNVFSYALMGRDTATTAAGSYGNNIFLPEDERPQLPGGTRKRDFGYYLGEPQQSTVVQNEFRAGWLLEPRSGMLLELAWTFRSETTEGIPALTTNYIRAGVSTNLHNKHAFQARRY
jgi:hypothetical protein